MLGNVSGSSKSNFAQAYDKTNSGKKDYISMVAGTLPMDSRSDEDMHDEGVFN